jgi:putative effector of murein hydrolase
MVGPPSNCWRINILLPQPFKIVPDLKQYVVAKLAPRRKNIIATRPNLVIALMAINLHMIVIQDQVDKNIVENLLLDGGSNVNIMMEEFWEWLGLPNHKLTSYTFSMADQTITKPIGLIKELDFQIHGIPYITTFMVTRTMFWISIIRCF